MASFLRSRTCLVGPKEITDENIEAFIEFLEDRSQFHVLVTSLVTGIIVAFTAFEIAPKGTALFLSY